MVEVDELQIIQLLQDEVARIVEDPGAGMVSNCREESLEGHTVVQIFSRMKLVAKIHAGFVEGIEYRHPALAKFRESLFNQPFRPLRPRIKERPRQSP